MTGCLMHMDHIIYKLMVILPATVYPVYIGEQLKDIYKNFFAKYPKIAIITNNTILKLYEKFVDHLKAEFPQVFHALIKDGEEHKNIATLVEIYQNLIADKLGRDGLIVAFGGGVVGDLAGFASATYMRGIDYIQIPTTLLAMVDSSIGGKTAINLPKSKNTIGAFHQPQAVFCDLLYLDTLSVREFNAGLMEVIKYGLILDAPFYDFIINKKEDIEKRDRDTIAYLINRCCQLKAEIVTQDEKDKGIRGILNFGHTIGHALESYTEYQFYLHGEAVAIGTLAIINYLVEEGILDSCVLKEFRDVLSFFQLPTSFPCDFKIDEIIENIGYDKKSKNNTIQWITLEQVGAATRDHSIDLKRIKKLLRGLQGNG